MDPLPEDVEGACLRKQHRETKQALQERRVPLGLQKPQSQPREDRRLQQVHELVELLEQVQRGLEGGEPRSQLRGKFVLLGPQAQRERAHRVKEPRF
eukprot:CAMPEP_0204080676 /NCGR_PEP_ID=MMETSP0360-20130528/174380_1 /ASSEMBLY_ACC=CAM_ASM_000342 /TAXON_ID=268821 /ORGANISM="Scrippsiella Hangoei, Strain SHTV-5" /LENGTH=96 /DNA_ID=CAMNT_0051029471 /DNA_START=124 /DNA_END=414 /DNA_ORIENTATION=+